VTLTASIAVKAVEHALHRVRFPAEEMGSSSLISKILPIVHEESADGFAAMSSRAAWENSLMAPKVRLRKPSKPSKGMR